VISSNPVMPVGVLGRDFTGLVRFAGVTRKTPLGDFDYETLAPS
jgi:hypothetical protein